MRFTSPPGVFDLLPEESREVWKSTYLWQYLEEIFRKISHRYGFREIRTPLLEKQELFHRSVGETSDVVSKEMYLLQDKGGRHLALRPEGTAPAVRAFLEHQLYEKKGCCKLFYVAPMFRYERSQAGRYRQHHQWGTEAVGSGAPEQDAEVIDLLWSAYQQLGLQHMTLFLNSLGDEADRLAFKKALIDYLLPLREMLSRESQSRLEKNALRILDSKDPTDREILLGAPSLLNFLSREAKEHFSLVQERLSALSIPYQIQPSLVRGLDYYNRTVFEVAVMDPNQPLGSQNSLGGGGRYDRLIQELGGPSLPAVGFGTGIERILQTLLHQQAPLPPPPKTELLLLALGQEAKAKAFSLLHRFRKEGRSVEMDFTDRKLAKLLQEASHRGIPHVGILGSDELAAGHLLIKEMATGDTHTYTF